MRDSENREKNTSPISYLHCFGFLSLTPDPLSGTNRRHSSRCTDPPEGKRWSLRLQVTFELSCHFKIFWYLTLWLRSDSGKKEFSINFSPQIVTETSHHHWNYLQVQIFDGQWPIIRGGGQEYSKGLPLLGCWEAWGDLPWLTWSWYYVWSCGPLSVSLLGPP